MTDYTIEIILLVFGLVAIVFALLTRIAITFGYRLSSFSEMFQTLQKLASVKNS
jgi:hypothetical protein